MSEILIINNGNSKFSGKKVKLHPEGGVIIDVPIEVTDMANSIATMLSDLNSSGDCDIPIPVKVQQDILQHVLSLFFF
jgi:hypothetical protein